MATSFGSYGPGGPGFGSVQNAPATGVNPTAFPTAPPSPGIGGGGLSPGGLGGMAGSTGLGNMVGAQVSPLATGPTPQPYRAPIQPAPPAAAPAAAAPAAAGPQSPQAWWQQAFSTPSVMNPSGNSAVGMANWGGFMPQNQSGSLFGLGGQVGAGRNQYWQGMGSGNGGAAGNGPAGGQ